MNVLVNCTIRSLLRFYTSGATNEVDPAGNAEEGNSVNYSDSYRTIGYVSSQRKGRQHLI
jgi:hypothetical protein